jgi:hypothetical protein
MYTYWAYGLGIYSEIELVNIPIVKMDEDISIRCAPIDIRSDRPELPPPFLQFDPDAVVFHIPEVGRFSVRDGREITVEPEKGSDPDVVREYLLGAGMAIVLHQRGRLVLHASAVNVNGSAIAFLGVSGAGKSTTALTLMERGYPLLVDDLAAIDVQQNEALIHPGFPRLKISPEISDDYLVRISSLKNGGFVDDKHIFEIMQSLPAQPLPIKCAYIVVEDAQVKIERLSTRQAVIELVRYTLPSSLIQLDRASHFAQCVKLAELAKFYRLKRPKALEMLPVVADRVEAHSG